MPDPIVKVGSDPLTAAEIGEFLERHPQMKVVESIAWRGWATRESLERRREHPGERSDFETRDAPARTNVR